MGMASSASTPPLPSKIAWRQAKKKNTSKGFFFLRDCPFTRPATLKNGSTCGTFVFLSAKPEYKYNFGPQFFFNSPDFGYFIFRFFTTCLYLKKKPCCHGLIAKNNKEEQDELKRNAAPP